MRARLLAGAELALRRLNYSAEFRAAVRDRLAGVLDAADMRSGAIDFSDWPEFTALDRETLKEIDPFLQRLVDAVSAEAFASLAGALLVPEVVLNVQLLTAGVVPPPSRQSRRGPHEHIHARCIVCCSPRRLCRAHHLRRSNRGDQPPVGSGRPGGRAGDTRLWQRYSWCP